MQRIKRTLPTPTASLLIGCVSVGVSTFVVTYDDPLTALWLFVGLTAVGISDSIMSTVPDDISIPLFFAVASCLNLGLFSLPALAIFGAFRKRLPERWTPFFGQVGSKFKVESAVHHMPARLIVPRLLCLDQNPVVGAVDLVGERRESVVRRWTTRPGVVQRLSTRPAGLASVRRTRPQIQGTGGAASATRRATGEQAGIRRS